MRRSSSRTDEATRPLTDDSDGEDNAFLEDVTAAEHVEKSAFEALNSRRNWLAFFILGTINNLGYVVVLSGAQSLADSFHKGSLIGLINWADVALGVAAKGWNTFFAENWSFNTRIVITGVLLLLGCVGVSTCGPVGFWLALISIMLIGAASALGESVVLGFLKLYPAALTGAWSSGTGMAGVGGSAFYLVLSVAGLSNAAIFGIQAPFAIIYVGVFVWMVMRPVGIRLTAGQQSRQTLSSFDAASAGDSGQTPLLVETKKQRYARVFRLVVYYAVHLSLVYFFEYVVSVGCAARANPSHSRDKIVKHAYAILSFCYQAGVLVSRSSLSVFPIQRIWILTILQGLNLLLWLFEAKYMFMNVWVQFVLMVYVGLLGGAMYVNVFALLVEDTRIPSVDRELGINFVAIFVNVGIVAASLFEILLDKAIMPKNDN